jgi:tetratricopeptide (TPR) repeat protein
MGQNSNINTSTNLEESAGQTSRQKNKLINLIRFERKVSSFFSIGVKITISILVLAALVMIYKQVSKENTHISGFHVPESFQEDGYSSAVFSSKLVDQVERIKLGAFSEKQAQVYVNSANQTSVDVEIMGIGISINTIAHLVREALGIPSKVIRGELTHEGEMLKLTLRITGKASQTFSQKVNSKLADGKYQAMNLLINQAAEALFQHTDPVLAASYYLWVKQDFDKCIKAAKYAIKEQNHDLIWAYDIWGKALEYQRHYDGAIDKYERAITIDDQNIWIWDSWGGVLTAQGKYEEAIEKYKIALEIDRKNTWIWDNWAITLRAMGDNEGAIEKYEKALQFEPENMRILREWASLLRSQGDYDGAIKKYQRILEIEPDNVPVLHSWASVLESEGKDTLAIRQFDKILEIEPNNTRALEKWGKILLARGDYGGAVEKYKQISKIHPDDINILDAWASTLVLQKKYQAAFEKYTKAIQIDSTNIRILSSWANALKEDKKYDLAIEKYKKIIRLSSFKYDKASAYFFMASAYGLKGDVDGFYENMELALQFEYQVWLYLNVAPYDTFQETNRFQTLLTRYKTENVDEELDDLLGEL